MWAYHLATWGRAIYIHVHIYIARPQGIYGAVLFIYMDPHDTQQGSACEFNSSTVCAGSTLSTLCLVTLVGGVFHNEM
jgi:hypothetical protein